MSPDQLLAFEASHPKHTGAKEELIWTGLGIAPARYYQLLNRAAHTRDGIAADPITARMVRERQASTRSAAATSF